jgi:hypothetical protein
VAAYDSSFPALVSKMCCSFGWKLARLGRKTLYNFLYCFLCTNIKNLINKLERLIKMIKWHGELVSLVKTFNSLFCRFWAKLRQLVLHQVLPCIYQLLPWLRNLLAGLAYKWLVVLCCHSLFLIYSIWHICYNAGNPYSRGRLNMSCLVKIACFLKKGGNIFKTKTASKNYLAQRGQPYWAPFSKDSMANFLNILRSYGN